MLSLIKDTNEDDYKLARIRLKELISLMCMCCEKTLNQSNEAIKYKKIAIIGEGNIKDNSETNCDYCDDTHLMCLNCFEKQKLKNKKSPSLSLEKTSSLKRTYQKKNKSEGIELQIDCMLCCQRHTIDSSDWPVVSEKIGKPICNPNCVVF